jgi:hypothetical protein
MSALVGKVWQLWIPFVHVADADAFAALTEPDSSRWHGPSACHSTVRARAGRTSARFGKRLSGYRGRLTRRTINRRERQCVLEAVSGVEVRHVDLSNDRGRG